MTISIASMSFPHEDLLAWIEKRPRCHLVAWELDPEKQLKISILLIFLTGCCGQAIR